MPEAETEKMSLSELVPSDWFETRQGSSVWTAAYRVLRVSKESLGDPPQGKVFDTWGLRIILSYGRLNYFDSSQFRADFGTEHQWRFDASALQMKETSIGMCLLVLAPFGNAGKEGNQALTRQRVSEIVGLLAVFGGRNIVYERLFENIVELDTGKASTFSPVFENPFSFPAPDVGDARLATILATAQRITDLQEKVRNRIRLSLRWFESAIYSRGVDAFLKFWIGLETLAMHSQGDIRPINEAIASTYAVSLQEAARRFQVGRVFGLRGRIVHNGQLVPIHSRLLDYVEAIYADVFLHCLGMPAEQRAAAVLSQQDFRLADYLQETNR